MAVSLVANFPSWGQCQVDCDACLRVMAVAVAVMAVAVMAAETVRNHDCESGCRRIRFLVQSWLRL